MQDRPEKLQQALLNKDTARIKKLCLEDPNLDLKKNVRTVLYKMIEGDYSFDNDCLPFLLTQGLDINIDGINFLFSAINNKNIEIAKQLLELNANPNPKEDRITPLYKAVLGIPELVEPLLQYGANPDGGYRNYQNHYWTPLYYAAEKNDLKTVNILLAWGAKPDLVSGEDKLTPYAIAYKNGFHEVCRALQKAMSDNLTRAEKNNSFFNSHYSKSELSASLLQSIKVNNEQRAVKIVLALMSLSAPFKQLEDLNILLPFEIKQIINQLDPETGNSLLYLAAEKGYLDLIKLLINTGAATVLVNKYKQSPLHAIIFGSAAVQSDISIACAEVLLENGCDINCLDAMGQTPLWHAAHQGDEKLVQWLITKGADTKRPSNTGKTPAQIAYENGHHKIVSLLNGKEEKIQNVQSPVFMEDESFNDPIEGVLFVDPVTLPFCGHSFSRRSISNWYDSDKEQAKNCPCCREPIGLDPKRLQKNYTLAQIVESYKSSQGNKDNSMKLN